MTGEPVKNQADMTSLTEKEIDWYKNHPPAGNWRQFCKIIVDSTIIIKKWSYNSNVLIENFFASFGMAKTLMNFWSMKKCYNSFNVLRVTVKEEFYNLTAENYDPKVMYLDVSHEGMKTISTFWYVYYNICQKKRMVFR